MSDLIHKLCELLIPSTMSPEYRAQFESVCRRREALEQALTPERLTSYCEAERKLASIESEEAFACGLHTGISLLLDLFPRP